MTLSEAVDEAIRRWNDVWFHWNKSQQSKNAVMALQNLMARSMYEDELLAAVTWLIGQSATPFNYKGLRLDPLKSDSALATYLGEEFAKVDRAPNLRPRPTTSTTSSRATSSTTGRTTDVPKKTTPKTPVSRSSAPRYLSSLARHARDWAGIEITDIPTDTPGVYKYTKNDQQTTTMKGTAAAKLAMTHKKKDIVDLPEYWAELGRLVSKHRMGRCYSCAALVVYTLVMDPTYDELVIAVMGNVDYDHQFVLIGTMAEVESKKGYVIDIWQSNLDKVTPQVLPLNECRYTQGNVQLACLLHPDDRATVRAFVSKT